MAAAAIRAGIEARRKRKAALDSAPPRVDGLLNDEELIHSTNRAALDPALTQQERERHDLCVLIRQQKATDQYHQEAVSLKIRRTGAGSPAAETQGDPRSVEAERNGTDATAASGPYQQDVLGAYAEQSYSSDRSPPVNPQMERSSSGLERADRLHMSFRKSAWKLVLEDGSENNNLARLSLCGLPTDARFRQFCIAIAENRWFDHTILLLILFGSVLMMLDEPGVQESHPTLKQVITICDELLLYTFTVELLVKIIAFGLVRGQHTYLRDNWNKLDALVVCSGWFSLISNQFGGCDFHGLLFCAVGGNGAASFAGLRTIRILRPLRAIKQFPGMKKLVQALLKSLPELLDSVILCGFILGLYGIVGVQLYKGQLQQRCVPVDGPLVDAEPPLCALRGEPGLGQCPAGFTCKGDTGINLNYNITSFDTLVPDAILTVFQAITKEGWTDIMYNVRKVKGLIHDAYFISLILVGALFMTNLIVGVLVFHFMAESASMREERLLMRISGRSSTSVTGIFRVADPDRYGPVRKAFYNLSESPACGAIVMILILLNTVVLALDNVISDDALDTFNLVFTALFFVEMVIKNIGLGPRQYIQDNFNTFDGTIVILSLVEIILSKALKIEGASITVLRTFRLLRVFKLARRMRSLRKILDALLSSIGPIFDLGLLLLLFMFVCALMGQNFFGCTEGERDDPNARWVFENGHMLRPNFSNFLYSMTTIFIVITGENWNDVMYAAVQKSNWSSAIFLVVVMVMGNYIVLNLFLAVLIDEFDKQEGSREGRSSMSLDSVTGMPMGEDPSASASWWSTFFPSKAKDAAHQVEDYPQSEKSETQLPKRPSRGSTCKLKVESEGFSGSSLMIFGARNRFRRALWQVVRHPYFDRTAYGLIAVSAMVLAIDTPDVTDEDTKVILLGMDYMLTALFTIEAALKITVYGFVCSRHAYMRDVWNVLDFVVVVISIMNLIIVENFPAEAASYSWVKVLRALRALRPLRMVSRNEGLKQVVNSICKAVPAIVDVMLVLVLFLLIFSILGVQLLKNRFYFCSCQDLCPEKTINPFGSLAASASPEQLCQGECPGALKPCTWERHRDWSFDNVVWAILTLFEVATLEMWPNVMWFAVDGVSEDEGPKYNHNTFVVLFFIIYVFIMSFFILNLFVGVVIDRFTAARNQLSGVAVMSQKQQRWIATQNLLLTVHPRPLITPPGKWRQLALQLITCREFEITIFSMIVLNVLVMCTTYYGASDGVMSIQENANYVFLAVFVAEAILKLFALRIKLYFRDPWNTFDFVIVVGSILADNLNLTQSGEFIDATTLRVFRVARIFRLVKSLGSLRKLLETLMMSMPSLVNVGAMLCLLFLVYTIAGMALFGDIQIEGNTELRAMNDDVNFRSFYLAMVMLFRMSTGESWNAIMHDCFSGARCDKPPHEPNCGNTALSIIFHVSFMLIGAFVFLNLFIAVIIEKLGSFDDSQYTSDVPITKADLDNFVECWARLAPRGEEYIPTDKLPRLLQEINPPLGFKGETIAGSHVLRLIKRLGIRDHGRPEDPCGRVLFTEIMWRLCAMVVGADMKDVDGNLEITLSLDKRMVRALTPRKPNGKVVYLAAQVISAMKLQSRWRARKIRQAMGMAGGGTDFLSIIRHEMGRTGQLNAAAATTSPRTAVDRVVSEDNTSHSSVPPEEPRAQSPGLPLHGADGPWISGCCFRFAW